MQNNAITKQDLSHDLVTDLIKERRWDRRWRNVRFFLGFFLILVILFLMLTPSNGPSVVNEDKNGYVSLIRLQGMIAPDHDFSAQGVLPVLHDAFADKHSKGVILDINSGGGTPVQASIIHDAILDMKKRYHKKVIVVGEDMLASGAYYVAVAADKIYVNPSTLTGSIGVIMKDFGFPELIKKIGVDRRVYTSGTNKDRLDPFLPQNPEDVAKIKQVLSEVHANFQQIVLEGRKGKLTADVDTLFSGDFWPGQTAIKLGLVDDLGNLTSVMQKEFNVSGYKDYSQTSNVLRSLFTQMGTMLNIPIGSHEEQHLLAKV
jgi:protease-4